MAPLGERGAGSEQGRWSEEPCVCRGPCRSCVWSSCFVILRVLSRQAGLEQRLERAKCERMMALVSPPPRVVVGKTVQGGSES